MRMENKPRINEKKLNEWNIMSFLTYLTLLIVHLQYIAHIFNNKQQTINKL